MKKIVKYHRNFLHKNIGTGIHRQDVYFITDVDIFYREEMAAPTAKKLPCNHIFHKNCLR
jgi:hypothetical protein